MINNNRQQSGRRRGRGGQRQGGGNQGNGSRIDNRARGNAAQLLEKYKSLAADAQRQGDRVNTEYYLQFADHYFRVVSEQRGRFEEQDRQRRESQGGYDSQYDGEDSFDDGDEGEGREAQSQQREPRESRDRDGGRDGSRDGNREGGREGNQREGRNGRERMPRRDRDERPAELPAGAAFASEGEPAAPVEQQERPRRARAPRRVEANTESRGETAEAPAADTFDVDRLPPSFAPANDGAGAEAGDDAPKPRARRRLRPAGEVGAG